MTRATDVAWTCAAARGPLDLAAGVGGWQAFAGGGRVGRAFRPHKGVAEVRLRLGDEVVLSTRRGADLRGLKLTEFSADGENWSALRAHPGGACLSSLSEDSLGSGFSGPDLAAGAEVRLGVSVWVYWLVQVARAAGVSADAERLQLEVDVTWYGPALFDARDGFKLNVLGQVVRPELRGDSPTRVFQAFKVTPGGRP